MCQKRSLSVGLCLILVAATAWAGPLDQLKNAAQDLVEDAAEDAPPEESSAAGSSTGTAAAAKGGKRPGPSTEQRDYAPGLSFSSLLNNVNLHYKRGMFSLGNQMQATFLEAGTKGCAVLRRASGEELLQYDFELDPLEKPYTLIEFMGTTDLRSGTKSSSSMAELKEEGGFVLDFYTATEHFYTFPFSISKIASDDPFGGEDWWVLSGDWDRWGYLYIPKADPEQNLLWKMWLRRHERGETAALEEDHAIRVTISGAGGAVCVSRDATRSVGPWWVRWEYQMAHPSEGTTTWGEYFKAKDLLAKDGDYTLTVKIDDTLYGTYRFAVKGGKFQYKDRTLRNQAAPLTFIEGGRDAWWYGRE